MALTGIIDDVFPQLLASCPLHFAMQETICICKGRCNLIDMSQYQKFRNSFVFKRFTYCFSCGCPNDKKKSHYFPPPFHQVEWYSRRTPCPYEHYLFKVIYALWSRDDLRPIFSAELGIGADTLEAFAEWAGQDDTSLLSREYFNGMTLMLWYCKRLRLYS